MKKGNKPLLQVRDLHIEFRDHLLPETVVYGVNLELYPGEMVGIVGESGSGKSMTALAIAGLLRRRDMQKKGEILFGGNNLLSCPRKILRSYQGNAISMVFQEPMSSLNPVKKIGWQVEEGLRIHTRLSEAERYRRALGILEAVELENPERVYHQYPHELSGGMRQRVMIASAMICDPQILIADEPTTALDVTVQFQIVELLKRMNREKQTAILFISHDLSLVGQLCERVLVMQGGYIVESGSTQQVFREPNQEYTKKLIAAIPACPAQSPPMSVPDGLAKQEKILTVKHLDIFHQDREKGGKQKRRQVLHDVSFSMKKGEVLGLVGESGSGKSTLVKTILGIHKDYTGEISRIPERPQMIFQDPYGSLNPVRKVGWILEEPLRCKGNDSKEERQRKVIAMLEKVGLDERFADRYPRQLSGGQRQRICIAGALISEPELLIADEPVSALDVTVQAQILELLFSLQKEMGLSILFISHDLRVVYKMCSRVMILQKGVVCEEGTKEEIYFSPKSDYTRSLLQAVAGREVS